MLEWLKNISRKQSQKNITRIVAQLIDAANEADAIIQVTASLPPEHKKRVTTLQKSLLFELNGPLPLAQVREEILEPALAASNASDGTRMAVDHVYNTALAQLHDNA